MKYLILALCLLLAGCGKTNKDYAEQARQNDAENIETQAPEPEKKISIAYESLEEAIYATKPDMADFANFDISKGALIFAYWATEHLTWADFQKVNSTKHALVMKDPDAERGEKICVYGHIVEIQVDGAMPNKIKVYLGGMFDDAMHVYRFIAIGSSGELVGGSQARFCGIVTGKNDYQNSNGGVAHAVHLVGMFDLPENK